MCEMDTWGFRNHQESHSLHILPVAELGFFQPLGRNKGNSVEVAAARRVRAYQQYWWRAFLSHTGLAETMDILDSLISADANTPIRAGRKRKRAGKQAPAAG